MPCTLFAHIDISRCLLMLSPQRSEIECKHYFQVVHPSWMMLTSFGKFGVASQHHPRPGPTGSPALQLLSSQSMNKASNEDTLFVYMLNLWVTSNGLQMPWVASCWDFADTHAHTMWNEQRSTTSTHFETDVKHGYFVHPFWYLLVSVLQAE